MTRKTGSTVLLAAALTLCAGACGAGEIESRLHESGAGHPLGIEKPSAESAYALTLDRGLPCRYLHGFSSLTRWRDDDPDPQGRYGIEEKPEGSRKLAHALWRSTVLPGWGQRYLGAPGRGWFFIGGELGTWGTWGIFKTQEWLRKRNYQEMAEVFAGVSGDHDDDYWKIVGQHPNWLDFNEWLISQARREYGFGSAEYYQYIADNEIAEADGWNWNNEDRREAYAGKRKASLNAERRATYTLYALLVNRVISLVDTWRLYRAREGIRDRLDEQSGSLDLQVRPDEMGLSWRLGWYRSF